MTRARTPKAAAPSTALVQITPDDMTHVTHQRGYIVSTREWISKVVIQNDEQCAYMMDVSKQIAQTMKEADEKRVSFVDPLNKVVKGINAFFKPVADEGKACRALIEKAVSDYKLAKEETQRRAIAEAERAARVGAPVAPVLAVVEAAQDFRMQGISTPDVIDVEVLDISVVPEQYIVRQVNIEAAKEAFKRGYAVPGLRFTKRKALHLR